MRYRIGHIEKTGISETLFLSQEKGSGVNPENKQRRIMKEQQQATIKDIAKLAGVSIATVDRVLHSRGRVSPDALKSVSRAIETLNYKPNQIARALSARRSKFKIGLALPNVESDFWGEIISGAEQAQKRLEPFGVELISEYSYSYEFDDQVKSIERLLEQDIQGLIVTPLYDGFGNVVGSHIPPELPYGTMINDLPGSRRLFHIGPNDYAIGALAARLTDLYCRGKGNVVILAPNHSMIETQNRISGFMSQINQDKLGLSIQRIVPVPGKKEQVMYDEIKKCTEECIRQFPNIDAFYVTNGLTEWCADAVVDNHCDGKIRIIGHEVTHKTCTYLQNNIVHALIYQRPALQIYNAINLMFEYLIGNITEIESCIISECSIIIKENLAFSYIGGQNIYGYR